MNGHIVVNLSFLFSLLAASQNIQIDLNINHEGIKDNPEWSPYFGINCYTVNQWATHQYPPLDIPSIYQRFWRGGATEITHRGTHYLHTTNGTSAETHRKTKRILQLPFNLLVLAMFPTFLQAAFLNHLIFCLYFASPFSLQDLCLLKVCQLQLLSTLSGNQGEWTPHSLHMNI